jgi:hypothetical protein
LVAAVECGSKISGAVIVKIRYELARPANCDLNSYLIKPSGLT